MDKIELRVVDHDGVPVDRHWHAVFGMAGGTIGRSGQNKLIISDPDSSVARVHAMVRLDSEGAFVANLSERDPIWVAEQQVRSGQEVPLPLGARIRIGAYTLAAVAPGTPFAPPSSAPVAAVVTTPAPQPQPQIIAPPAVAEPTQAAPDKVPLAAVMPAAHIGIADPLEGLTALSLDAIQALPTHSGEIPAPSMQAGMGMGLGMPQPAKPQHRSLLIPKDFDPFALPPTQSQQQEGWAGLPSQGPDDLIAQRHDGMVHTLPLKGLSTEALHDASHTGLPPCFEPSQKKDPLALIGQSGLPADAAPLHQASGRGSELGQAFNLPRMQSHTQAQQPSVQEEAATPAQPATQPVVDPVIDPTMEKPTVPVAEAPPLAQGAPALEAIPLPPATSDPVALGSLLPVEGLDLDLFRSGTAQAAQTIGSGAAGAAAAVGAVGNGHGAAAAGTAAASILGQGQAAIPVGVLPSTAAPVDAPVQPQPDANADLQALARAFMEGAGLNPAKTHFEVTPEFMRTFGEALRIAVQGTIDLLAARSEIKREFRAGVTIIATGANNPLKFLPNSEGVLMQMVHQTFPGFMKPLPAMQDAFQDLHVHQLALMAGIRAAYAEALTRFDPTELERRTETNPGLLDKLLTNGRKAALWDDYKHNFDVLRRHAEDDLMAFSGRTFVEAYENAEQSVKGQP